MTGNSPAIVQDAEIDRIKACEDADGLVHLPKLMPELYADGDRPKFKKGQVVRVKEGVYSGYEGIYEGCGAKDREKILLEYLGRKTRVLIGVEQLEQS
jgi:transcription antitermination factor NusG